MLKLKTATFTLLCAFAAALSAAPKPTEAASDYGLPQARFLPGKIVNQSLLKTCAESKDASTKAPFVTTFNCGKQLRLELFFTDTDNDDLVKLQINVEGKRYEKNWAGTNGGFCPNNAGNVQITDLNKDGKPDFILHGYCGGSGLAGNLVQKILFISNENGYLAHEFESFHDLAVIQKKDNSLVLANTQINWATTRHDQREHSFWVTHFLQADKNGQLSLSRDKPLWEWYGNSKGLLTPWLNDKEKQAAWLKNKLGYNTPAEQAAKRQALAANPIAAFDIQSYIIPQVK